MNPLRQETLPVIAAWTLTGPVVVDDDAVTAFSFELAGGFGVAVLLPAPFLFPGSSTHQFGLMRLRIRRR